MPSTDPLTVVLPVSNPGPQLGPALELWLAALAKLGRSFEVIVVDDGSIPPVEVTPAKVKLLRHETPLGFGASLRTGFAAVATPLVFYTAIDYPYTPSDLAKLVVRIEDVDPYFGKPLDVVSGCRSGCPVPGFWKLIGTTYRLFCRVALGLKLEPAPGWLGFREHLRSWLVWVIFGDALTDPNSAFKLFRKNILDRYPVQSDGEFVHVELIAKATFTICLMDELPLTPHPVPVRSPSWAGWSKIAENAKFNVPSPGAPSPVVVEPTVPQPATL